MLCLLGAGCGGGHHGGSLNSSTADSQSGSKASDEGSTVNAEAGSEASASSLTCPSAEQLQENVELPITWTLQQRNKLPDAKSYPTGSIKRAYKRYCVYSGSDHNSFLYMVFASYPDQVAKEQFAGLQQHASYCREPSICWRTEGDAEHTHVLGGTNSFVSWHVTPPTPGGYPTPYLSELEGTSTTDGVVCELPLELPQRLAAENELELETAYEGLLRFVRSACGLSEEEEEGEEASGSSEGVSSLAGTTDDQAGAEQTSIAYDKALVEKDYDTACELVVAKYLETLPEPCAKFYARVFGKEKIVTQNMAEVEAKAIEATPISMQDGDLLWDGSEWLVNPEAPEEGIEKE